MESKKRHFATKSPLEQLNDSDSDMELLPELSDSESWGDLSSGTDLTSDDSGDDPAPYISDVRTWCPIECDTDQVAPPRFPFTGSPGMKVEVERTTLWHTCNYFSQRR